MSQSNLALQKRKILFILTGSIACFKAVALLSKLKQKDYDVQVVATQSALEFIGEATLEGISGKPVVSDLFGRGQMMDHIYLQRWADLILVCPATANYINRISQGIGEDLASTLFLAHDFKKPFLLAPAMNSMMYLHPVTQESLKKLQGFGVEILESASGVLACGETGYGRLLEPDQLLAEVETRLGTVSKSSHSFPNQGEGGSWQPQSDLDFKSTVKKSASGSSMKALVTAGGTYEPIDNVRVLTNLSTGKTGQKIATYLQEMGFEVDLLVSELSTLEKTTQVSDVERFSTFTSLKDKMSTMLSGKKYGLVIHAAAVGDYHVSEINGSGISQMEKGKIPSGESLTIKLEPNPKIINLVKEISPSSILVGFKLTSGATGDEQSKKVSKIFEESRADFVVSNDLTDVLHKKDGHGFQVHSAKGGKVSANDILQLNQRLFESLNQSLTVGKG